MEKTPIDSEAIPKSNVCLSIIQESCGLFLFFYYISQFYFLLYITSQNNL